MTDADEERLELRLLTEPSFGNEFDIVVDEITDDYIAGDFQGDEKRRVEEYFLKARQRQEKVQFTRELLQQAGSQRAELADKPSRLSILLERFRSLFQGPVSMFRLATTLATALIITGAVMVLRSGKPTAPVYTAADLQISRAERSEGAAETPVKLSSGTTEVRMRLALPEPQPTAETYHARLAGGTGAATTLPVLEKTPNSVTVIARAAELPPGSYAIQLWAVNADGAEQRIRGSYLFRIE